MKLLSFVLVITLYSLPGYSQWEKVGPFGGYIQDLVTDNQGRVLAATPFGGIFRTSDGGKNWEQVFGDYLNTDVRSLAVNPDGDIFAGTDASGLYRSNDDGITWELPTNIFSSSTLIDIYIQPDGDLYVASFDGIFKSTDNGKTFSNAANGIPTNDIFTLGEFGGYLFAGTYFEGIYRSSDEGLSWEPANNGITFNGLIVTSFGYLTGTKNPASAIYAAAGDKIYRSYDAGDIWETLPATQLNFSDLHVKSADVVLASSYGGKVIRSDDGGNNFIDVFSTNAPISTLTEDGEGNTFAGTYGPGTYVSQNTLDWVLEVNVMTNTFVTSFGSSVDGGVVNIYTSGRHGILGKTSDFGQTWQDISGDLPYGWNNLIDANPVDGNLYVSTTNGGFRSIDEGLHWENIGIAFTSIAFNSTGDTFLGNGAYVYKADFGSLTFDAHYVAPINYINEIVVDDNDDIYLSTTEPISGTGFGVYYSNDGAETFNPINTGLTDLNVVALENVDISGFEIFDCVKMLVAVAQSGSYYVKDNNNVWSEFSVGLGLGYVFTDIASLNTGTNLLIDVVSETGFHRLDNNNCSFSFNSALFNIELTTAFYWLQISGSGTGYYGTNGSGVIKQALVTSIEDQVTELPQQFRLEQNYPNPFNPETVINYELPVNGKVILKVYDLLGREVAELVNEEKSPGRYAIKFSASSRGSNLSSGVYYYQLRAGTFIGTKKFVILK